MPYSAEHKAQTRRRIVTSARRLFNRRGFANVSIDEIMAGAGLTRGGFYAHFRTKSELYAEAITQILEDGPEVERAACVLADPDGPRAGHIVEAYLSREHLDTVEGSCPMIALPGDVARGSPEVQRAFRKVLDRLVGIFEVELGGAGERARERALAVASLCVGGMVLARAVDDRQLGDRIREAACALALETGAWSDGGA